MMKKFYGLLSLIIMFNAVFLASIHIFRINRWWSLIDLFLLGAAAILIVRFFCTKCPVKKECAHVIPGWIARYFKNRQPTHYTRIERVITFFSMGIILLFPQYWLIKNIFTLACFWILTFIGFFLISKNICGCCDNLNCPLRRSEQK
ncbi:hypothetical protein JW835_00540 [bacterium]|nr:hypothetical protein [bacterium]